MSDKALTVRKYYYKKYKETKDLLYLMSAIFESEKQDVNRGIILYEEHHQIHREIHDFISSTNKDCLIQVFVGGGKTNHILGYISKLIYEDPTYRALIITASKTSATKRNFDIQKFYETTLKIHDIFKPYKNSAGNRNFRECKTGSLRSFGSVHKEPTVQCMSIKQDFMGDRTNIIVGDDLETEKNYSEMPKIKNIFFSGLEARTAADARIVVINTPYYIDGLIKELEKSNKFSTLKMGLSTKLIDKERTLEVIEELLNTSDVFYQYIAELLKKNEYIDALKMAESKANFEVAELIKSCLDFRIYKQVIINGEIVEEDILPQWDYLVYGKGSTIINTYLKYPDSYMLQYALTPELATSQAMFEEHKNCLCALLRFNNAQKREHIKFFSYDIAGKNSYGTVITEYVLFLDGVLITVNQYNVKGGSVSILDNVNNNTNYYHVIENNAAQEGIISLILNQLPDHLKDIIIEHQTTNNKNHAQLGVLAMEQRFKNKTTLFLETGTGINELMIKLSTFDNNFVRRQKHDNVMSLWIGTYNIMNVINKYNNKMKIKNNHSFNGKNTRTITDV